MGEFREYRRRPNFTKSRFSSKRTSLTLLLLEKNIMHPIKTLFENSTRGILFSQETIKSVENTILSMSHTQGFDSFLKLQSLLYDLALSRDQTFLTHMAFAQKNDFHSNQRIEIIYRFLKDNYQRKIKIEEVAE